MDPTLAGSSTVQTCGVCRIGGRCHGHSVCSGLAVGPFTPLLTLMPSRSRVLTTSRISSSRSKLFQRLAHGLRLLACGPCRKGVREFLHVMPCAWLPRLCHQVDVFNLPGSTLPMWTLAVQNSIFEFWTRAGPVDFGISSLSESTLLCWTARLNFWSSCSASFESRFVFRKLNPRAGLRIFHCSRLSGSVLPRWTMSCKTMLKVTIDRCNENAYGGRWEYV
jgi:hypothetical protein